MSNPTSFADMFAAANAVTSGAPAPNGTMQVQPQPTSFNPQPQPAPQQMAPQGNNIPPATNVNPNPTSHSQPASPGMSADDMMSMLSNPQPNPNPQPNLQPVAPQPAPAPAPQPDLMSMLFGNGDQQATPQPNPTPQPAPVPQPNPQPVAPSSQQPSNFQLGLTENIQYSDLTNIEGISSEQRSEYAQALPMMDTIVRARIKEALASVDRPLSETVGRINNTLETIPQQVQSTRQENYRSSLQNSVPNLGELLTNNKFAEYLNQQAQFEPGVRLVDKFKEANRNMNLPTVLSIINGFTQTNPDVANNQQGMYHTPYAAPVAPSATGTQGAPMLSMRTRQELYNRMRQGDQQVKASWPQIEAAYTQAEREGRLTD